MLIIGCDPGLTGAISLLCSSKGVLACEDLPTSTNGQTSGKMLRWVDCGALQVLLSDWSVRFEFAQESIHAVVERPIAMPTLPAQTVASQFDTFGVVRALVSGRVSMQGLTVVNPRVWKGSFGLKADKNASIALARKLYPAAGHYLSRKKDHNRAESILIGHWLIKEVTW